MCRIVFRIKRSFCLTSAEKVYGAEIQVLESLRR